MQRRRKLIERNYNTLSSMIKENIISILTATIILIIIYCYYHTKIAVSSDSTTMLPLAMDFSSGNFLLKGWVTGTNNFFFTETIFYIPGLLLGISGYKLEAFISSLTMACIVVGLYYTFLRDNRFKYLAAVAILTTVGLVSMGTAYTLLNANSHNGSYALLFVVLAFISQYRKTGHLSWLFGYYALGTLIMYSDGISLMSMIVPVVLVCMYMTVRNCFDDWKQGLLNNTFYVKIAFVSLLIWASAKGINWFITSIGGLVTRGLPMRLVGLDTAWDRAAQYEHQFLLMWGYNYGAFGKFSVVYNFLITIIIILFFASIFYYTAQILRGTISERNLFSWLVVTLNIAGCLFTNTAIFHRYLVPLYLFGTVLVLCMLDDLLSEIPRKRSIILKVVWTLCVVCFVLIGANRSLAIYKATPSMNNLKEVAAFLDKQDWGDGYGQFWCASITASLMDFRKNIIMVTTNQYNFIAYPELIKKSWYSQKGIHYTLTYIDDKANSIVSLKNTDILSFLGTPDKTYDIGIYRIMYWDKDISDYLLK